MTGVTEFKEEYDFDFQGNQTKTQLKEKSPPCPAIVLAEYDYLLTLSALAINIFSTM